MRSSSYILGMVLGIAAAVAVCLIANARRSKKTPEFDERQMQIRGRAFQTGFFTLGGYVILDAFYCVIRGHWTTPGIDLILGVFVSIAAFLVVAIRGDAYLSLGQKPRSFALLCVAVILCQIPNILVTLRWESFLTGGLLNGNCLSPCCAALFLLGLVLLLTHRAPGDGEEGDET